eukprot:ANDGO_03151.mRNA.1 Putative resolvase R771
MFETARTIRKKYDISSQVLRKWATCGKLQYIRTSYQRLYNSAQLRELVGDTTADDNTAEVRELAGDTTADDNPSQTRSTLLYARVSSQQQESDLQRQIADLRAAFPGAATICDVGSGVNFHRSGFKTLLGRVLRGEVERVVVTHRDRLCRFAIDLVEWFLEQSDTELVVLGTDAPNDSAHELADDFLAISNFYVASSINGRRPADNSRKRRREATGVAEQRERDKEEEIPVRSKKRQAASQQRQDDQDVSHSSAAFHAVAEDVQQGISASQGREGGIRH